jgi:beta-N-acetylhexosaminidase
MKRALSMLMALLVLGSARVTVSRPADAGGAQLNPSTLMASEQEAARWADETLKTLSLAQKVGQLICPDIRGEYIAQDHPQFQRWLTLARDYGVGGFVVYGGTPHDTARLLNRLQEAARLPLLISADFEGGPGQQFAGASEFPANMALAAAGSDRLAYEVGRVGAREGRAIGIHLTYSPVVDVQTNPQNPALGVRSFGRDVDVLGRLAAAYIRGYQENGMAATAKHFPGRGDVELLPGTDFTINRKSADRVEREDFLAFKKAIDAGVAFVMSEHIAVPAVTDGSDLPASVNKVLATTWLRDRLGFKGVLTSDDLWYPKMVARFGAEKTCILALQAGHDVLLKPADPVKAIAAVVDAVRAGQIPEAQINASARKLLVWKARLNLHRKRTVDLEAIDSNVGIQAHRDLVQQIADESITVIVNNGFFPSSPEKLRKMVHVSIQRRDTEPAAAPVDAKLKQAFPALVTFLVGPNLDPAIRAAALKAAATADTIVVSLFSPPTSFRDNGPLREPEQAFLEALVRQKPLSTVVMSYGNPYQVLYAGKPGAFVTGYGAGGFAGNQVVYADSFVKLLRGSITPRGRIPVKISDGMPVGTGITY